MIVGLRWLSLILNVCLFIFLSIAALNYQTSVYLIYQAKGQLSVLLNAQTLEDYQEKNKLSPREKENILLVQKIKRYSVDSLGYLSTNNFTCIYNQKNATTLWVVTACEAFSLKPYLWNFPIVGKVSYKGFFKKEFAEKELNKLISRGYDADLRGVSAWSTLGWFNDPLLSSMLDRSKGGLCNLLFHELFHATYYAPNAVNFNENLANFISHKATQQFLKQDIMHLNEYCRSYSDNIIFNNYMLRQIDFLKEYYPEISNSPDKNELKLKALEKIADSIQYLPLNNKTRYISRTKDILKFKNAYLIDFIQYDSMQDSLEKVFNKIYKANIKKMVQDLKAS